MPWENCSFGLAQKKVTIKEIRELKCSEESIKKVTDLLSP
jgi:hypothetical protein